MAGNRRNVSSLYQRPRTAGEEAEGSDRRRRKRTAGRRRGPSPPMPREEVLEEEEEVAPVDELDEELVRKTGEEEGADEDDDEAVGTGSASSSASSGVYLRGPASLPQRPIPRERRPLIQPEGKKTGRLWRVEVLTHAKSMASWGFCAGNTSLAWLSTPE